MWGATLCCWQGGEGWITRTSFPEKDYVLVIDELLHAPRPSPQPLGTRGLELIRSSRSSDTQCLFKGPDQGTLTEAWILLALPWLSSQHGVCKRIVPICAPSGFLAQTHCSLFQASPLNRNTYLINTPLINAIKSLLGRGC